MTWILDFWQLNFCWLTETQSYLGIKARIRHTEKLKSFKRFKVSNSLVVNITRTPVSVVTLLTKAAEDAPDHTALAVERDGDWVKWSYERYLEDVRCAGRAFIKLGLKVGHGVGIIGFNSPEWFFADLGCVFAGGLATGIYPTNSAEACKYVLANCKANIVVVEDDKQLAKILTIKDSLPELKQIVQYSGTPSAPDVLSWDDLMDLGDKESDDLLDERISNLAPNLCCHLVYTSGTTGPPKGVMLSHDNLTFTSRSVILLSVEKYFNISNCL